VIATLATRRLGAGRGMPRWASPAAGFSSGALATSTSTSGPPMLVYLLGRGAEPEQVRDTLTVCFIGLAVVGAVALWVTGTDALPDAALVAWLVPVVAAAHLAGRPVFARLARGGRYETVMTSVLLVSIVAGLVGAVA
jgi:uncharacterized protein